MSILTKFFNRKYHPLNKIYLKRKALISNYLFLQTFRSNVQISPVLKSNSYGHGLKEISQILDPLQAPFFCVDSLYEAYQLLNYDIKTPILIMGAVEHHNLTLKHLPFQYAVFDIKTARVLNQYQKGAKIHLFIDTGMHREGIKLEDLPQFISSLKKLTNLEIAGVMTHLAEPHKQTALTKLQMKNFEQAITLLNKSGINPKWRHIGGSEALFHLNSKHINLVRTGIALFGLASEQKKLKPVLELTSKIIQIKTIKKGESIGYDATFTAPKEMKIGILPIGYFDGVDRRLSNKGLVLVNKKPCKILGLVSMNLTAIDLTNALSPKEVVIYSACPDNPNSIYNLAKLIDTIPYEILIHLASSTRREIID